MSKPIMQLEKERSAQHRAENQLVYISGLQGVHSLETGIAYYYRGHYIYAWPNGNPIEPAPSSTGNGISVREIAPDRAPVYDPNAADLVPESSINFLGRARVQEQQRQREFQNVQQEEAVFASSGVGTETVSRAVPFTSLPHHQQPMSQIAPNASLASQEMINYPQPSFSNDSALRPSTRQPPTMPSLPASAYDLPQVYIPQDQATHFASSTSGSLHAPVDNIPYNPLTFSTKWHQDFQSACSYQIIPSTSRLTGLPIHKGMHYFTTHQLSPMMAQETDSQTGTYLHEAVVPVYLPQPISYPTSHPAAWRDTSLHNPANESSALIPSSPYYLPGLGHPDMLHTSYPPSLTMQNPSQQQQEGAISTGMSTNAIPAHNVPYHQDNQNNPETYNGEPATELHTTEQVRTGENSTGEHTPTIRGEDWSGSESMDISPI